MPADTGGVPGVGGNDGEGGVPGVGGKDGGNGKVAGCELCEAARFTPWFHEDEVCWVAECEVCAVPMVVWNRHGTEPPEADLAHMLGQLERVAGEVFAGAEFSIDQVMRQIPDHFHAHARDRDWRARRFRI